MAKTESEKEMMNRLYKAYGLTSDDIFTSKHYKIITRAGIQKIEANSGAQVTFNSLYQSDTQVRLEIWAKKFDAEGNVVTAIQTTGEASSDNVKQQPQYLLAMAEKRGRSRAILTIEGLYADGFYGEDEADDFKDVVRQGRQAATRKATYKGE